MFACKARASGTRDDTSYVLKGLVDVRFMLRLSRASSSSPRITAAKLWLRLLQVSCHQAPTNPIIDRTAVMQRCRVFDYPKVAALRAGGPVIPENALRESVK
jgi:hypothetical protein